MRPHTTILLLVTLWVAACHSSPLPLPFTSLFWSPPLSWHPTWAVTSEACKKSVFDDGVLSMPPKHGNMKTMCRDLDLGLCDLAPEGPGQHEAIRARWVRATGTMQCLYDTANMANEKVLWAYAQLFGLGGYSMSDASSSEVSTDTAVAILLTRTCGGDEPLSERCTLLVEQRRRARSPRSVGHH